MGLPIILTCVAASNLIEHILHCCSFVVGTCFFCLVSFRRQAGSLRFRNLSQRLDASLVYCCKILCINEASGGDGLLSAAQSKSWLHSTRILTNVIFIHLRWVSCVVWFFLLLLDFLRLCFHICQVNTFCTVICLAPPCTILC